MFAGSTIVEALDLHEKTLIFRSRRDFQIGQKTSVKVALPPGSGRVVSVEVEVAARRSTDQNMIYTANVVSDVGHLQFHVDDPAQRDAPRAHTLIRVMSKDLPHYKAIAVDLSATGAQLETDQPLEVGHSLQLQFELENFHLERIRCQAEVVWSRPALQKERYRAGVHFVGNSPEVSHLLLELANSLDDRAHTDLHSLLEQAKILGPVPPPAQPAHPAPSSPPPSNLSPGNPPPGSSMSSFAAPMLTIPLRAFLKGYRRSNLNGSLVLTLVGEEGPAQELEFCDCQYFLDIGSALNRSAVALTSRRSSPLLDRLQPRHGKGNWKHYQLLDADSQVIVEIASGACRPLT